MVQCLTLRRFCYDVGFKSGMRINAYKFLSGRNMAFIYGLSEAKCQLQSISDLLEENDAFKDYSHLFLYWYGNILGEYLNLEAFYF